MRKFFVIFLVAVMALGGATVTAFAEVLEVAEEKAEVEVPVIMYHLITDRSKYIGKYGILPADLEADLAYLKENGYTTIVVQDLQNFVEGKAELPAKPIMLTFDDGNTGDYDYLLPLLKQYDMKAVVAFIGSAADKYTPLAEKNPKAKYPNMTWGQIRELHESGHVEIQSHSYDLHGKNGSGKRKNESPEAYHARLLADLKKFQDACKENLDYEPTAFIYPLGVVSDGSRQVLEELGMVASFSCEEGMNFISPEDKLFKLKRVNRPSKRSVSDILGHLREKKP